MEFSFTFDKHKIQPDLSLAAYAKSKHIELGELVLSKTTVYLDTKFWIIFRDVALGRNRNKAEKDLYELCVQLAKSGQCIFPLSDSSFMEVMKQTDQETLKECIRLIDLLSGGVSLINARERMNLEIMQLMDETTGKATHKCAEMVWTRLTYVLGFVTPILNYDEPTNLAIQKTFFDQMWSMSLADFLSVGDSGERVAAPKEEPISEELNKMKFMHAGDSKSFQQMLLNEIAGILDVVRKDFPQILSHIYEREMGKRPSKDDLDNTTSIQPLVNILYNLFKFKKAGNRLPTLHITAGLHAAIRWDKNQKFQENDSYDLRHAASGLPYCDYLLTERRLAHLVTQNLLAFDKLYNCVVLSSPHAALEALRKL